MNACCGHGNPAHAYIQYARTSLLHGETAIGLRAPKRKRRKRLAKKIELRGGMLRARGVVQAYRIDGVAAFARMQTMLKNRSRAGVQDARSPTSKACQALWGARRSPRLS